MVMVSLCRHKILDSVSVQGCSYNFVLVCLVCSFGLWHKGFVVVDYL